MNKNFIPMLALVLLAGCSNQQHSSTIPEAGGNVPGAANQQGGASATTGINNGSGGGVSTLPGGQGAGTAGSNVEYYQPGGNAADLAINKANLDNPKSPLSQRIIYFDYDQATILPKYRTVLEAHGQLLRQHPELRVRLEGHADERGTRDYNVALSERRAKTVEWFLTGKGVGAAQMDVIAYGEEKPVRMSSNEQSWAENRRVEIRYQNR